MRAFYKPVLLTSGYDIADADLDLDGCWKGEPEPSYLWTKESFGKAIEYAKRDKQEAVLYLASDRAAYLIPVTPDLTEDNVEIKAAAGFIGYFSETNEAEAKKQESYTYHPGTHRYYVVRSKADSLFY